jgi:hypothetical protein
VWAPKHELSAAVVFDGRRASLQQPAASMPDVIGAGAWPCTGFSGRRRCTLPALEVVVWRGRCGARRTTIWLTDSWLGTLLGT